MGLTHKRIDKVSTVLTVAMWLVHDIAKEKLYSAKDKIAYGFLLWISHIDNDLKPL
jgi:hypothetical protein